MRRLKSPQHAVEEEDGESTHLLSSQQNSSAGAEQYSNFAPHTGAHQAPASLTAKCGNFACCCARTLWDSGLTCSLLASLIFSFSGLFVKLTGGRVPVLEVCLIRSSISFVLTIILMKGANMSPIFGQRSNLRLLCARGCCGACSMTTWYIGLFLLPLGDAVTIGLIGPAVTAVVARVFLKEPLGYRGAFGCVVSMAGVVVLSHPPFLFGGNEEWSRTQTIGTAALILSAVLGSGSSLAIRLIGKKEPAAVIAMWFHTCTMILTSIPLALGLPNKLVLLSGKDFSLLLGVAGTSFVAQLLSTRGLQMVMAAKAAAMGFTQVFYSYILGAMFFGERVSLMGLAGVVLILVGVLMVTMRIPSKGPDASDVQAAEGDTTGLLVSSRTHYVSGHTGDPRQAASIVSSRVSSMFAAAVTAKAALADDSNETQLLLRVPSTTAVADGIPTQLSAAALLAGAPDALGSTQQELAADAAVLIKAISTAAADTDNSNSPETRVAAEFDAVPATSVGTSALKAKLQARRPGGLSSAFRQAALQAEGHAGDFVATEMQKQLSQAAAESAAAALGGELCPASTASLAHSVSHMSRHTSSNAVLCISLQKSSHLAQLDSAACGAISTRSADLTPGAFSAEAVQEDAKLPLPANTTLSPPGSLIPDGRRATSAEQAIPAPNASRQFTKQLTSFLAASLLAVSPELGQLPQHGRLQEALLDASTESPGVSSARGEQQQQQRQLQQGDSEQQLQHQPNASQEVSISGQLTDALYFVADGTLLPAATEVNDREVTESAVVHRSSRTGHQVRTSSTL